MAQFRNLGIAEPLWKAIKEENFEEPSEIQAKSIPLVLEGKDVIACAATGSGKTLAFGSGIIQYSEKGKGIQALVLTPTRELAEQVSLAMKKYSKYRPLSIISVYGGVSIGPQIRDLKTADVVIGTPGRILDHIQRRTIQLNRLRVLVLDEADRMLDMGFIHDVEKIIRQCPPYRQTLLFSATITGDISRLAQRYMKNPVEVSAESEVDPEKLEQVYYDVPDHIKFSLLVHLLKNETAGLVMVFCNTKGNTDFVADNLKHNGINAQAIHGGLTQDRRSSIMQQFHSKNVCVLVCTDVASRGLDIKGVSHVYNYDIPHESKAYIHRIGRTARAGAEGKAINILTQRDYDFFRKISRDRAVRAVREELPQVEHVKIIIPAKRDRFGGGRPGGGYGRGGGPPHGRHGRGRRPERARR